MVNPGQIASQWGGQEPSVHFVIQAVSIQQALNIYCILGTGNTKINKEMAVFSRNSPSVKRDE